MSTLRLESSIPQNKPKSRVGLYWDRLTSSRGEPPYRQLPDYHIRVVKIKQGTSKYPLRVKLKVIDPRRIKYAALSYTWESNNNPSIELRSSKEPKTILCGGSPVRITQNLYEALCQIRDVQSDTLIFVDALCINFGSSQERTELIKIMGHIYSRASSVIVWLGKKQASSDQTIFLMRKLVNAIDWRKIGGSGGYDFRDPQFFSRLGMEPLTLEQWRNIHHFCHLEWFTRYWAFFELTLAKTAVFLYGNTLMDYEFLIDFGMILGTSGLIDGLTQISNEMSDEHAVGLTRMLGPVARLRSIPPWHPKHPEYAHWMRDNYGLQNETERAWKFFEILLQSAEEFACRDPRDKVYAPLALVRTLFAGQPLNKEWPIPQYDQPVNMVYDQFSNFIAKYTHEPSILATATVASIPPTNISYEQQRGRQTHQRMALE